MKKNINIHSGLIVFICWIFLLFPPVLADEMDSIGKVIALRGNVFAQNKDLDTRKLSIKAPVFLHDTIQTNLGRIQLVFKDNTLITLGRNTEMKLSKYSWEPEDKNATMITDITEGSFRIMGGAITRIAPDNFKTNAPSGTIGIRGSMYAGRVAGALLSVVFQGGKGIYVKNDMGMVSITRPGFGTTIKDKTQAPEKPKKIDTQQLLEIEKSLTDADQENIGSDEPDSSDDTGPSQSDPIATGKPVTGSTEGISGPGENSQANDDFSAFNAGLNEEEPLNPIADITSVIEDTSLNSAQEEFNTLITPTETQQAILEMLADLGFTGSESTGIPGNGIWTYQGKMQNTITNETPEKMTFIVNWDNRRLIATEDISSDSNHIDPGFGFGTIDSSGTITNVKVMGSGGDPNGGSIMALSGSETYGHFYGSAQEGLGLAMEGYDVNIQDQTDTEFWSDIIAAVVDTKQINPYAGTEKWNGFFTGVGENMNMISVGRRVFHNTDSAKFELQLDKTVGTVSGTSMQGTDFLAAANKIDISGFGGAVGNSVYLYDKMIAADLYGGNVTIGSTSSFKRYGNYIVTSDKDALSDYTTWGYWEVAYSEPGTSFDYHIHVPSSMWIAGVQTPTTVIDGFMSPTPGYFSGTYAGKAQGVLVTNISQMTQMTNGTVNLDINFQPAVTNPVTGTIFFNESGAIQVNSAINTVQNKGFNAYITGANIDSSEVNGTFYGPGAEAIGGNFAVKLNDTDQTQYHGIFAGDLQ